MNHFSFQPLILALTLACLIPSHPLLADQRIAIVDLRSVFDGYFKTKAADATLKERAGEFDKEKKALLEQYQSLTEEYKKTLQDANNQAVSADERDKLKKTAESKLIEVKESEQTIQQFDRQALSTLQEQEKRIRTKLLEEIQNVVDAKARAGQYTLVFDTAAESANRTPIILFSSGEADLTKDVLDQLNAAAPENLLGTPPSTTPPKK